MKQKHLLYRFFKDFLKKYLIIHIIIVAVIAFQNVIYNLIPLFNQKIIDDVFLGEQKNDFWKYILLIFMIILLKATISYITGYFENKVNQNLVKDVREKFFAHVLHMDMSYFDRTPAGDIVSRIENDIDVLQSLLSDGIVSLISNIFEVVFIFYLMAKIEIRLTIVSFFIIIGYLFFSKIIIFKMRESMERCLEEDSKVISFITEVVTKISSVKLFCMEPRIVKSFSERQQVLLKTNLSQQVIRITHREVALTIYKLTELLVWVFAGLMIMRGNFTLGALTAFISYQTRCFEPVLRISDIAGEIANAGAALERVYSIFDMVAEDNGGKKIEHIENDIRFFGIDFGFPDKELLYKKLNIELKANELVCVVGRNGAGKSTFINLLTRFYKEEAGIIKLDGIEINEISIKSIRSRITIIPQKVNFFNLSLKENLGVSEENTKEMNRLIEIFQMEEFISKMPHGVEEIVNENESNLSGGEKQKLGIMRALLKDADILIMDEPSSYLDHEQRVRLFEMIAAKEYKFKVMISHNLEEVTRADRVIMFENGRIVADGKHGKLMEMCDAYRDLWKGDHDE